MSDFRTLILEEADQRTAGWAQLRAGRFTASSISTLFTEGRDKAAAAQNEGFGATAVGMIKQKAMEIFLGHAIEDGIDSYEMRFGRYMERPARDFYEDLAGVQTIDCTFVPYGDSAGGSPDFVTNTAVLGEIKVPKPSTHADYLLEITNFDDLKRVKKEYWHQLQSNMVFTGLTEGVFISFDPRMIPDAWTELDPESFSGKAAYLCANEMQKKTAMLCVYGELDPTYKEILDETLNRAVKLRNRFLEQISNRFK